MRGQDKSPWRVWQGYLVDQLARMPFGIGRGRSDALESQGVPALEGRQWQK